MLVLVVGSNAVFYNIIAVDVIAVIAGTVAVIKHYKSEEKGNK